MEHASNPTLNQTTSSIVKKFSKTSFYGQLRCKVVATFYRDHDDAHSGSIEGGIVNSFYTKNKNVSLYRFCNIIAACIYYKPFRFLKFKTNQ